MESSSKLPPTRNGCFSHLDPHIETYRAWELRGVTKEKKKKYPQSQLFLPKANSNKWPYLYPLSQHIPQANPLLHIASDGDFNRQWPQRIRNSVYPALREEGPLGFSQCQQGVMHHYESSTELTSIEIETSRQPMSRFCSWAIGWTWWGPGRARTWRITSILWRLGPIHKRHIGARRHSGYWRIYGLVCVYLEYLCLKVRYGKTGAMDVERWRQRVLQLIYLSLPQHNRIGSHFCMYSCSPSSGALDSRVDPIDREFIPGLDAREANPITSDCNSLSSTMLLPCNVLVSHMQAAISFVSRVSSFCCLTRKEEEQIIFPQRLGVRMSPKAEPAGTPIGQSCLKRRVPTADCRVRIRL